VRLVTIAAIGERGRGGEGYHEYLPSPEGTLFRHSPSYTAPLPHSYLRNTAARLSSLEYLSLLPLYTALIPAYAPYDPRTSLPLTTSLSHLPPTHTHTHTHDSYLPVPCFTPSQTCPCVCERERECVRACVVFVRVYVDTLVMSAM
jgi:hypothetical protein